MLVVKSIAYQQPGGGGGTQGKLGWRCAAEAFKPWLCMRQKLPISLPKGTYFMTLIRLVLHTLFSSFKLTSFGTTKVDRSSPTFTFLLPTQKDTLFKILNSEIVDPENHTGPVQLHIPGTRLGQIKECPSLYYALCFFEWSWIIWNKPSSVLCVPATTLSGRFMTLFFRNSSGASNDTTTSVTIKISDVSLDLNWLVKAVIWRFPWFYMTLLHDCLKKLVALLSQFKSSVTCL